MSALKTLIKESKEEIILKKSFKLKWQLFQIIKN